MDPTLPISEVPTQVPEAMDMDGFPPTGLEDGGLLMTAPPPDMDGEDISVPSNNNNNNNTLQSSSSSAAAAEAAVASSAGSSGVPAIPQHIAGGITSNGFVPLSHDEHWTVPDFSTDGFLGKEVSLADLFGEHFEPKEPEDGKINDPALVDTRRLLQDLFGPYVREEEIDLDDEKLASLAQELEANKAASKFDELVGLFGEFGATSLETAHKEFSYLHASPPKPVDFGAFTESWLMDMPKIDPNRQTLHADPTLFHPDNCPTLESNARMLYTSQNVIRWTYHRPTSTFMSNARVVRWNDGSLTLHVGSDVFEMKDSKDNSLHILCLPASVRKGNLGIPAIASSLNPDRHLVLESSSAPSVERAVIEENTAFRSVATKHRLAFSAAPLPQIDLKKPPSQRTPLEDYVIKENEKRKKEMERRDKEGRPVSLTEQIAWDNDLQNRVQALNEEELVALQHEQEREAALRAERTAAHGGQARSRRNRFDRQTAAGGYDADYGRTPQAYDDQDNADGSDDGENDEDAMSFEDMMVAMQAKRDREDEAADEQRREKMARHETLQSQKYEGLIHAMEEVLSTIPSSTASAGSLQETLGFIRAGSFSKGTISKEIPLLMDEIRQEIPNADLSKIQTVFEQISK